MYENHMIHMHPRCTHIHETSAASPSKPESKKKRGGVESDQMMCNAMKRIQINLYINFEQQQQQQQQQ